MAKKMMKKGYNKALPAKMAGRMAKAGMNVVTRAKKMGKKKY